MSLNLRKLKVALIGVGKQSIEVHIPAIKISRKVKLVALVDKNRNVVTRWSQKLGVPGYTSVFQLLKHESIHLAIVAVPHDQYLGVIKALTAKRIHILKEKPLALNWREATEIEGLVKKSGVKVMISLQRRFDTMFLKFPGVIKKIGRHFFIEARRTMFVENPHLGWRGDRMKAGGGCIIDMGYHLIDLLIWYFGLPDKIHAEYGCGAKPMYHYDAEDTAVILFQNSESGLFGEIVLSRYIHPKEQFIRVMGSKGIAEIRDKELIWSRSNGRVIEKYAGDCDWVKAAATQIDYFVEVIFGKKPNVCTVEDHLKHMAFIEACYQSRRLGQFMNPYKILHQNE